MREMIRRFRAMNTDISVVINDDVALRTEAEVALHGMEVLFGQVENLASRFRRESELSRLNGSAGRSFRASPLLFTLVTRAIRAAKESNGIFDPTILGSLTAAGYNASFELVTEERPIPTVTRPGRRHSWRDVKLNTRTRTVLLPRGCGLDLGGIGKGWTVDLAASRLRGFANYAVDAGGDIFARGVQSNGREWTVGVEDPFHPDEDILTLRVRDRAVATSTVAHRHWRQGGIEQHHLIDPRTGQPSQSGVVAATVIAETVARAEVLAKVALLLGPEQGARYLEGQPGAAGLLILADGRQWLSRSLREARYVA